MTVVDFENLNPGAKFTFEEDKKGKALSWVKIRAYTNEALEMIRDECIKQEVEYKRVSKHGGFQRIEYTATDENKMKRMLWDYVITDWGGFTDKSGKDIPCTAENKAKFMLSWPAFQKFIDTCLDRLTPDVEEAIKESEKN